MLNVQYAAYVREQLDHYGYHHAESILNEWNPGTRLRGTLQDSANISSNMIALQYTSLDMLMYYNGQVTGGYDGMYNPLTHEPFKAYYVFKAFSQIFKCKNCRTVTADNDDLYCIAASEGDDMAIMITNLGASLHVSIENALSNDGYEIYRLNDRQDLELDHVTDDLSSLYIGTFETVLIKSKM